MRIYTRTGDDGGTGLFGGARVSKSNPRVEAYGTVDELNSVIGVGITHLEAEDLRAHLEAIQHDLFAIGAVLSLAPPSPDRPTPKTPALPLERIPEMESWIDEATSEAGELRAFVLPGGSAGGAALHHARTVCRRAERRVVSLGEAEAVDEGVVRYLNRLSDLLFAFARVENHRTGNGDVTWDK